LYAPAPNHSKCDVTLPSIVARTAPVGREWNPLGASFRIGLDKLLDQWPVDRLIPYARNARTHTDEQVTQVAASIAEFGWTNPILVGGDGIIIAGHARLAAARKLQMSEVPVIVLDYLTETQRRALVLADTNPAASARLRRPRPLVTCSC
jgi:hypothetical protein